jgi:hypothetical protein
MMQLEMIDVAPSGWDPEPVCYGGCLDCPGGNFMLYNRKPYGKDGFGAARIGQAVWPSPRIVALPEFSK